MPENTPPVEEKRSSCTQSLSGLLLVSSLLLVLSLRLGCLRRDLRAASLEELFRSSLSSAIRTS